MWQHHESYIPILPRWPECVAVWVTCQPHSWSQGWWSSPTENPDKMDKPCFEFICGCRVSFVSGLSILSGVFVTHSRRLDAPTRDWLPLTALWRHCPVRSAESPWLPCAIGELPDSARLDTRQKPRYYSGSPHLAGAEDGDSCWLMLNIYWHSQNGL